MSFKFIQCTAALALLLAVEMTGFSQSGGLIARYTASTVNTSSPGDPVRFDLLRWSTDAERDQLFMAVSGADAGALAGLLQRAPTVGYVWTTESAGYPIRYAYRSPMADGGDRIVLATERLLGSFEPQRWKLTGATKPTDYTFTVIEIRVTKAGLGEGRTSLTTKVIADKEAKTIALEDYTTAPVLFQGVKK